MLALVLGGGNALGAYHGGVVETLAAEAVWPEWIAGSSIGAITAALIAGNKPERRLAAVREFWRRAAQMDGPAAWVPDVLRRPIHFTAALQARVLGRPLLYHLRLAELLGGNGRPGLYDRGPMRRALEQLVDFNLLNQGPIRVAMLAVDVETGAEVAFDTAHEPLTVDHLMASSALIPDFPAVEIGGRALVDGGLAANVPADLVLAEPARAPLACITLDPYPIAAPRPRRLTDAAQRQTDLTFACQTARTLRAMRQLWEGREGPPGAVYSVHYTFSEDEIALKSYDFAQSTLDRRWACGRADMARALRLWREQPPAGAGLRIHSVQPAEREPA
ncbi:MAG TPA: patatin-like phospholipase family protein [Acetobacteraceae bacterium]|nr:patatin-like phospholipase family protein [Acetobacteraceae bacterium]